MQSVLDYKPAGQLWVMYQLEPPIGCDLNVKAARYADVFDITVSYRRDSDIWRPYGLVSLEPNSSLGRGAWLPRVDLWKRKMAVGWFVSHCETDSKRELLAKQLSIYIPVDKYGGCGPLKCFRSTELDCFRMLERDYVFYFAAEHALCEDYVTEKLFNLIMHDVQVIPIVYGSANYSSILPPNSYIDANSFPNVTQLGIYLIQVASNETLFNSYLESRKDYTAAEPRIGCGLCNSIHHFREKSATARDVNKWFVTDTCYEKSIQFE